MASDTRMTSGEAERVKWFERCMSDSIGEFDYELTEAENKNTKRKTETDMRIFSSFLLNMNEKRPAETIDPEEMDRYLTTFFSIIKKHDGNEYEPASLRGMLCSIERYLRHRNYPRSLTRDIVFIGTRNTLRDRQIVLREIAKTTKKCKQEILTASSIDKLKQLYSAREFGPYNPMAVINTLCFAFVVHLKIRKAIDHKQLLWGDIALKTHNSREYLCYEPVQGRDFLRQRLSNISSYRIYAQSDAESPADPVAVYKLYTSKRPSQAMSPDSPFYLGLAVSGQTINQHPQWFKCSPMGVNKLNDLVRMIREITGSLTMSITGSVNSIMNTYSRKYPTIQNIKTDSDSKLSDSATSECDENTKTYTSPFIPDKFDIKSDQYNTHARRPHNEDLPVFSNDGSAQEYHSTCSNQDRTSIGSYSDDEHETDMNSNGKDEIQKESTSSRLDKVKQSIMDTMNTLDDNEKQEIGDWFMRSFLDKDTVCHECNSPRHFNIRFTWKPSQPEVLATVQATSPGTDNLVSNTLDDDVHDKPETYPTVTRDSPDSEYEENNTHGLKDSNTAVSNPLPFKRKLQEEDCNKSKLAKTLGSDERSDLHTEEHDKEHEDIPPSTVKYACDTYNASEGVADCCNLCRREPERIPQWFAPWALDPRLAFYLRQGLAPYSRCQTFGSIKDVTDA